MNLAIQYEVDSIPHNDPTHLNQKQEHDIKETFSMQYKTNYWYLYVFQPEW